MALNVFVDVIETRCTTDVVRNLEKYALKHGLKKKVVLYAAVVMWLFAGGSILAAFMIKRFEKNPKQEYLNFINNEETYVLECGRYHAQVVRMASSIAHKEYTFKINNKKIIKIPKGTTIGAALLHYNDHYLNNDKNDNNDSESDGKDGKDGNDDGQDATERTPLNQFKCDRNRKIYDEALTWNVKDGRFFDGEKN